MKFGNSSITCRQLLQLILLLLFSFRLSAQTSSPEPTSPADRSYAQKSYAEGAAALQRGDLESARASFTAAVRQDPRNAQARNALGLVVLAQDPIGQGERFGYYEAASGTTTVNWGTTEHDYAGAQCLPLGDGTAQRAIPASS